MHSTLEHLNKTEDKGKTNSNTIIIGDFNTSLSTMDISFRELIKKKSGFEQYRPKGPNRYTESIIILQQNIHYYQVPMKHFLGQTIH